MNKEMDLSTAVGRLESGMTIGFGGWGPRRKPMALVREILRSDLTDLTVVGFCGPELGMLCAAGKVKRAIYGFVSLDAIPLEPYFRKAREAGQVAVTEWDEGMFLLGLRTAAEGLPFSPTRVGLGTHVPFTNNMKTIKSPYDDGEVMLAMPAIKLDMALIHVNRADLKGNTQTDGPDPYFDNLVARAAGRVIVTAEEVTERLDLTHPEGAKKNLFDRCIVEGVVKAAGGAHPTTAHDAYGWDMKHLGSYAATAAEENGFARYMAEFVGTSEQDYQAKLGGLEAIRALPIPTF